MRCWVKEDEESETRGDGSPESLVGAEAEEAEVVEETGAAEAPKETRLPIEMRPESRREEALEGKGRAPPGRETRLLRRSAR